MMNNKDNSLKDNKVNQVDKDINEMMNLATGDNNYEPEKKSSRKTILIMSVILILAAGAFGLSKLIIKPQEFVDNTTTPDLSTEEKEYEKLDEWDFKYPAKIPKWSKQVFNQNSIMEEDEVYQGLMEIAENQHDVLVFTASMPDSKTGDWDGAPPKYTNDISQMTDSNGLENELFSYTLKEDYQLAYSSYIQQLINPVFGDWVFAQRYTPNKPLKDNKDLNVLKPLFSEEWWAKNIKEGKDYSALPILVDWEGDDFGGLKFAERVDGQFGTWFGVINTDENNVVIGESLGLDDRNSPIVKFSTPIKFSAFGVDNKIIEKTGTLELTLGSNPQSHMFNRVVIIDAVLILK